MPKQLNKYIIALISLAVIVGVPIGVIYPSMQKISELSASIIAEYQYLNERSLRGFYIKNLRQDYEALVTEREALGKLSLETGAELDFIIQVEKLADSYQLKENLQLQPKPGGKAPLTQIPFTITTTGTFQNNVKFMHDLQGLPLVVIVDRVRLSGASAAPAANDGTVTFNLSGLINSQAGS
jgi:Tfp pilus assembly protein PilO